MEFRTKLNTKEIKKLENSISYTSKIGLIGSCFVENIGEKLDYYKFPNWINPFGILFSPTAIENALNAIVSKKEYTLADLVNKNERWHSFDHHSDFSSQDFTQILSTINQEILITYDNLKTSSHLIITLGTAWVYRYKKSNKLVANCHKIPQKEFGKELLSFADITESLQASIELVKSLNPNIDIVITLSPIRHLKDGMLNNSRSKANLLSAIHAVIENSNSIFYFPSYEIMLDDLRNYRFYTKDMLHPNETSINYIWGIFKEVWLHKNTAEILKKVEEVQKGLQHKAFNPNSEAHQKFIKKNDEKQQVLFTKYKIRF